MKLPRRNFLQFAGAAAVAPAFSRAATAQTYPSRPVTMIVPFAPGGPTDVIGRVLAERMRDPLGQAVVVENVSGGDGLIGIERVARARPDGYTIGLGSLSWHILNGVFRPLPYHMLDDFQPIAPLVGFPWVMFARKTMPANDLNELIAWLKTNPGKASFGTVSAVAHVLSVFFQKETGTRFTIVPYRGSAPAMQDLVAGQIDVSFDLPPQLPQMRAGSIKAYAVTSDARPAQALDIPTFAEMGLPALSFSVWQGIFTSRSTPADIIGKLNTAAVEALADPAVRSRFAALGLEIFSRERQTPEAFGGLVKADVEKWLPVVKELGIKVE
jgi:tripartite-type tricarboxylate transporter receptor subunit TctC